MVEQAKRWYPDAEVKFCSAENSPYRVEGDLLPIQAAYALRKGESVLYRPLKESSTYEDMAFFEMAALMVWAITEENDVTVRYVSSDPDTVRIGGNTMKLSSLERGFLG